MEPQKAKACDGRIILFQTTFRLKELSLIRRIITDIGLDSCRCIYMGKEGLLVDNSFATNNAVEDWIFVEEGTIITIYEDKSVETKLHGINCSNNAKSY